MNWYEGAWSNLTQGTKFSFKPVFSLHKKCMYSMPNSMHVYYIYNQAAYKFCPYHIRSGEWSFKNYAWVSQDFIRISQSRCLVFLAVLCVSQSRFFIQSSLGVRTFCKVKGLEVLIPLFVFISDVFQSLDNKTTFKFPKKF